jgi:hypothetical protein
VEDVKQQQQLTREAEQLTVRSLLELSAASLHGRSFTTEKESTRAASFLDTSLNASLGTSVVHATSPLETTTTFAPFTGTKITIRDLIFSMEEEVTPPSAVRIFEPDGTPRRRRGGGGASNNNNKLHAGGTGEVLQTIQAGGSMIVQFEHAMDLAEHHLPFVPGLVSSLEKKLHAPVSAHLYVKGPAGLFGAPGGSALSMHVDPTDVLVFQLAGCNRWTYCVPPPAKEESSRSTTSPSSSSSSTSHTRRTATAVLSESERSEQHLFRLGGKEGGDVMCGGTGPPESAECRDVISKAGDVTYIPRAVYHKAQSTTDECPPSSSEPGGGGSELLEQAMLPPGSSVHLTLGIHRKDSEWVHLLEAAMGFLPATTKYDDQSEDDAKDANNNKAEDVFKGAGDDGEILADASSSSSSSSSVLVHLAKKAVFSWRRQMPTWILAVNPEVAEGMWNENIDLLEDAVISIDNNLNLRSDHQAIAQVTGANSKVIKEQLAQLRDPTVFHAAVFVWQQGRLARKRGLLGGRAVEDVDEEEEEEAAGDEESATNGVHKGRSLGATSFQQQQQQRPKGRRLCNDNTYGCAAGKYSSSGTYTGWDCDDSCDYSCDYLGSSCDGCNGGCDSCSSCSSCPLGQYQNSGSSTGCKLCPVGEYQDSTSQSSCKACQVGRYEPSTGSSTCDLCDKGKYQSSTGQSSGCTSCPTGRYETSEGSSGCDRSVSS